MHENPIWRAPEPLGRAELQVWAVQRVHGPCEMRALAHMTPAVVAVIDHAQFLVRRSSKRQAGPALSTTDCERKIAGRHHSAEPAPHPRALTLADPRNHFREIHRNDSATDDGAGNEPGGAVVTRTYVAPPSELA